MAFGRIDGHDGRAFAQAVAFQQFGAREFGFEVVNGLSGQRCPAADKQTDAVEPSEIPRDFGFAHGSVNGRYAEENGSAFEQNLFQHVGEREDGFDQNNRAGLRYRQQNHGGQRKAVEHGQEDDETVFLRDLENLFDARKVGKQVAVTD